MCYSSCNRYLPSLCPAYLIREITNFINVIVHRCNVGLYFAWPKIDGVEHEIQLNTIRLIQRHLNPKLQIAGVLLTMFDARFNLSRQVATEVKSYFGNKVYKTAITRNVRLAEAPSYGQPIVLYDILSPGAQNYMSLAGEVINHG